MVIHIYIPFRVQIANSLIVYFTHATVYESDGKNVHYLG